MCMFTTAAVAAATTTQHCLSHDLLRLCVCVLSCSHTFDIYTHFSQMNVCITTQVGKYVYVCHSVCVNVVINFL